MIKLHPEYTRWLSRPSLPPELREELGAIQSDHNEIEDRFYRHLEFGTGGLRGILGAGTNRMNLYTVARASQGLADYLNATRETPSVCIAYDTRNKSKEFALMAARVFCANGVKTWLYDDVRPTPMLSFAVRNRKASAGVVITASHNPKEYNGYKVYGPDGGQITDEAAAAILDRINEIDVLDGWKVADLNNTGLLSLMGEEVDAGYYGKVKSLVMRKELLGEKASDIRILYSPLHGSGNVPVRRVLRELGFSRVQVVPEQELPDGNFPTVPYPNPEEPEVFRLAKAMAETERPDLIFSTDPDCDRIGVLARDDKGEFIVLTGNQVGALLCDYIIRTRKEANTLPANGAVIKTNVTTDLAKAICDTYGVAMCETLTGFKYIGELIGQWEENGRHTFLLGFEESYGYLAGEFVRDKDAVIASVLITEMALYYKEQKQTLFQALQDLFGRYGYSREKLISVTMPGAQGQERIREILSGLREDPARVFPGEELAALEDYKTSTRTSYPSGEEEPLLLPKSNVLKFFFADGSWLVIRPSGTEPKVKLYLAALGGGREAVDERIEELERKARALLQ